MSKFTGLIFNYHFITTHGFCGSGIQGAVAGYFFQVVAISQWVAGAARDGWQSLSLPMWSACRGFWAPTQHSGLRSIGLLACS